MNKRCKIILAVFVLLVVVAVIILIWNFWLVNSPSVQAWITDWVKNPIGLTAIATVGAAIGTVGAVIVALFGIRYERKKAQQDRQEAQKRFEDEQAHAREELKEERDRFEKAQAESQRQFIASQKQTQDALEEGRRQFLETQYTANKPLLVPEFYWYSLIKGGLETTRGINIRNEGTGIATNITLLQYSALKSFENLMINYIHSPIPKNDFKALSDLNFQLLFESLTPNDKIGTYTLG